MYKKFHILYNTPSPLKNFPDALFLDIAMGAMTPPKRDF